MSTVEERRRRRLSVLRIVTDHGGLTAEAIGRRLGDVSAREVRDHIRMLRAEGRAIVIGDGGHGYWALDAIDDADRRARMVQLHWYRTRAYMIDAGTLLRQIGGITAVEIAQHALFDALVPAEGDEKLAERPVSMRDLASLPIERRRGVFELLATLLDGIARDPTAFAIERAALAERFGPVFLSKPQAEALAEAKRLLASIEVA